MVYLKIDLDHGTSTVILCDVYCDCPISTAALMCSSNRLDSSIGYGFNMQVALLDKVGILTAGSSLSHSDIPKLVQTKLDHTNWNAWKIEIIHALCLKQFAHFIGMNNGVAWMYDEILKIHIDVREVLGCLGGGEGGT